MLLIIKLSQKIFENIPTTLDAYRGFYKWKCEVQTSLYSSDAVCGKKNDIKTQTVSLVWNTATSSLF
jgi:hypothetical protein